ncbi:MAG: hypothetical protein ABJF10_21280 [Chthoniobacter sp.]|uniref:hypothetical protein n=1 Tax=Chthoniobacter sp. TaxID=2510640 RepID=UPI0032AE3992
MKSNLLTLTLLAALAFVPGCTSTGDLTPQAKAIIAIAKPIADEALIAAAAHYGVPPDDTKAILLATDSVYGAIVQARNGQPVDNGSTVGAVGDAIAGAIPAGASNAQTITALTNAAAILKAKAATTQTPTGAQSTLPTLYYGSQTVKGVRLSGPKVVLRDE